MAQTGDPLPSTDSSEGTFFDSLQQWRIKFEDSPLWETNRGFGDVCWVSYLQRIADTPWRRTSFWSYGNGKRWRSYMDLHFDSQHNRHNKLPVVGEGTPRNSSGHSEGRHDSKMFALVIPQPLAPGDGASSSTATPAPVLWLDSGATHHVVGDDRILTDLHDPPAGMAVSVADGFRLPVAKIGAIQTPDIKIRDVYFVPGLAMNLISVRQLGKNKIITTFYENHAELWLGAVQIGGAIIDETASLYKLRYLGAT